MIQAPSLPTERFLLRPLQLDDVNQRYLAWFNDPGARHIVASATTRTLADLRTYVADKLARQDVAFLGIFTRDAGLHIGNLKFEPVDLAKRYAVVGILIGDPAYRGRGVTGEVLAAAGGWLKQQGVEQILLGVEQDHAAAIRAYEKAGFCIAETPHLPPVVGVYSMVWTL